MYIYAYIVLSVAGNKCDLINNEEVDENDAMNYSNTVNASFFSTSAYLNTGITKLFRNLGHRYLAMFLGESNPNDFILEGAANQKHTSVTKKDTPVASKRGLTLENTKRDDKNKHKKKCC